MKRYDLETINKTDFRTWATGKLPDDEIDVILQVLNQNELWNYKQQWIADNP